MDPKTIERLFRQHYGRMYMLARTLLYDEEESRDVVSEIFTALLRTEGQTGGTDGAIGNVEAYLMASVRHRCLDLLAHKDVRSRFEMAYTAELDAAADADGDDERLERLMAFINRELTQQTRTVFRLRHVEGLKYQEIADRLGISRTAVCKHLAQAMRKIKAYISNNQLKRG